LLSGCEIRNENCEDSDKQRDPADQSMVNPNTFPLDGGRMGWACCAR
jgi:hypothetical protein